jgi:hypothetical protein
LASASAKKLLKKIAESRALELELIFSASRCPSAGSAAAMTWLWSRSRFPIGAELVEFPAAFRIAQNLVGFVDFLEFFLRRFFIFGDIGMILARECTEGLFDFVIRRLGVTPRT